MSDDDDLKRLDDWYDRKSQIMQEMLGEEHDHVMHAIIPYGIGGGLDLYYYPNGIPGTGVATKELCESPGEGSSNDAFDTYELVMFTKQTLSLDDALDASTAFGRVHTKINAVLNGMAPYSAQATLNPRDTCEFPEEIPGVGGTCLIFDAYPDDAYAEGETPTEFGLLAVIEIFRSEMSFARENGGANLLQRLKMAGHYPYSDMDREPVV